MTNWNLRIGKDTGNGPDGRRDGGCARGRNSNASMALALIARLPLRLPDVTGLVPTGPMPARRTGNRPD